jgi:hypothetical protein
MDVDVLLGACAGLLLSALLVTCRDECARWVVAQVDGSQRWTPPLSGAVTGTGIFFAIASLWLLVVCFR